MTIYLLVYCGLLLFCLVVKTEGLSTDPQQSRYSCTSNSNCSTDQCCVVQSPFKGRKKRQSNGSCQPLGAKGDNCYVGGPDIPPPTNEYSYDFCPCASGLTCQNVWGYQVVPQGLVGTCQ